MIIMVSLRFIVPRSCKRVKVASNAYQSTVDDLPTKSCEYFVKTIVIFTNLVSQLNDFSKG